MKKDIAERWVKALRSGEYKQGTDGLRIPAPGGSYSYCCLGVLCHILVGDNATTFEEGPTLPRSLMAKTGMRTVCGEYSPTEYSPTQALTSDNDRGADFSTIADTIDKHWKEL